MKVVKSQREFKEFYQDAENVRIYDKERSRTIRKRIVRQLEQEFSLRDMNKHITVLEVGFGTGFITEGILRLGNKVIGVDTSKEMLNAAFSRLDTEFPGNIILHKGSIFDLKLLKENYAHVVSIRVFIHLPPNKSELALKKLISKTTNEGLITFDLPSRSFIKNLITKLKSIFSNKKIEVHNFQYSKQDIYSLINKFNEIRIHKIYSIDHLTLLLPLYILSYLVKVEFFFNLLLKIERKLKYFPFMHTKWMIVCKKI